MEKIIVFSCTRGKILTQKNFISCPTLSLNLTFSFTFAWQKMGASSLPIGRVGWDYQFFLSLSLATKWELHLCLFIGRVRWD